MSSSATSDQPDRPIRVSLTSNLWRTSGGTSARGHAHHRGKLLRASELAAAIDAVDPASIPDLLDELRGEFAVVKEHRDALYLMVDQIRSIPLYAVALDDEQVVTDDPLALGSRQTAAPSGWQVHAEFLTALYVTGNETLLAGVRGLEAGTILEIPRRRGLPSRTHQWFAFRPNVDPTERGRTVEGAYECLRAAVDRTIEAADGSLIVVPLSAGLDSGIVACLLAAADIDREQILTFTYGRPENRESNVSGRVAATLGLRWEFVPYDRAVWQSVTGQPGWPDYLAWASSLTGVPGFTDIPAIRDLTRREVIPEGSVIVPGHAGDWISGSFIPGSLVRRRRGTRRDVVRAVLDKYYKYRTARRVAALLGQEPADVEESLVERVDATLPSTPTSMSSQELVSATEQWGWKERQSKMIANGIRVYEPHGLRWAMPWWDRDVVDFWAEVPLRQRVAQRLRGELGSYVGWPVQSRSTLDRFERRVYTTIHAAGVESRARVMRDAGRRVVKDKVFRRNDLACFEMFGRERFDEMFHGRETARAMLAEDVLASLGVLADER